jgi:asparagine N-glycosylation enzyme membrane subunit Stt3
LKPKKADVALVILFCLGVILLVSWIPLAFIISSDIAIWFGIVGILLFVISIVKIGNQDKEKLKNVKEKLENKLGDLNEFKVSEKFF